MTRQAIIERTIKAINRLPEDKAEEISDITGYITIVNRNQYCSITALAGDQMGPMIYSKIFRGTYKQMDMQLMTTLMNDRE